MVQKQVDRIMQCMQVACYASPLIASLRSTPRQRHAACLPPMLAQHRTSALIKAFVMNQLTLVPPF